MHRSTYRSPPVGRPRPARRRVSYSYSYETYETYEYRPPCPRKRYRVAETLFFEFEMTTDVFCSNRVGRIFVVLLSLCLRGVYGAVQGGLRGSRGLRSADDAQILRTYGSLVVGWPIQCSLATTRLLAHHQVLPRPPVLFRCRTFLAPAFPPVLLLTHRARWKRRLPTVGGTRRRSGFTRWKPTSCLLRTSGMPTQRCIRRLG